MMVDLPSYYAESYANLLMLELAMGPMDKPGLGAFYLF